jgi:DNA mismatch repair ATPase MutL
LYILDQHTAHERVLFEETMRMMDAHGSVGQNLLLTVQLELGAEQMGLLRR